MWVVLFGLMLSACANAASTVAEPAVPAETADADESASAAPETTDAAPEPEAAASVPAEQPEAEQPDTDAPVDTESPEETGEAGEPAAVEPPAPEVPALPEELRGVLASTTGEQIDLASFRGEDVVLWFWAPW